MGDRFAGILRAVHLLPLVVWLGGAVMLFAAVAPVAFAELEARGLAGRVVGGVIRRLDLLALAATPILIATALYDERRRGTPIARWVRASILAALGGEAAVSYFAITPRIAALRDSPSNPGAFAGEWPHRAEFDLLHGISMGLMIFGVLCALAALYFAVRRRRLADALEAER